MMPPMTAAIRTPKAPTPPRSSAAGGFENVVEPVAGDELAEAPVRLDPVDVPLAGADGFEAVELVEDLEDELDEDVLADAALLLGEL